MQPPLQIGLGVEMRHHFRSKFLIDSLNEHGSCSSYSELKMFERCSAVMLSTEIPNFAYNHFLQYAPYNVDHNARSIDDNGTFHGMDLIIAFVTITLGTKTTMSSRRIKVTYEDIGTIGCFNIHNFSSYTRDIVYIQCAMNLYPISMYMSPIQNWFCGSYHWC